MTGLKTTTLTSEQMRQARAQGQSASNWQQVRQKLHDRDSQAQAHNQAIAELIERKRGRPIQENPKRLSPCAYPTQFWLPSRLPGLAGRHA